MKYGYAVVLERGIKIPIYSSDSVRGVRADIIIWEKTPPDDIRTSVLCSLQMKNGIEFFGMSMNDYKTIKSLLH